MPQVLFGTFSEVWIKRIQNLAKEKVNSLWYTQAWRLFTSKAIPSLIYSFFLVVGQNLGSEHTAVQPLKKTRGHRVANSHPHKYQPKSVLTHSHFLMDFTLKTSSSSNQRPAFLALPRGEKLWYLRMFDMYLRVNQLIVSVLACQKRRTASWKSVWFYYVLFSYFVTLRFNL